jgi:2-polyprenyl-3-methyl-5-hydroxy-6-metoxy-1,4-benzoquinol methylase
LEVRARVVHPPRKGEAIGDAPVARQALEFCTERPVSEHRRLDRDTPLHEGGGDEDRDLGSLLRRLEASDIEETHWVARRRSDKGVYLHGVLDHHAVEAERPLERGLGVAADCDDTPSPVEKPMGLPFPARHANSLPSVGDEDHRGGREKAGGPTSQPIAMGDENSAWAERPKALNQVGDKARPAQRDPLEGEAQGFRERGLLVEVLPGENQMMAPARDEGDRSGHCQRPSTTAVHDLYDDAATGRGSRSLPRACEQRREHDYPAEAGDAPAEGPVVAQRSECRTAVSFVSVRDGQLDHHLPVPASDEPFDPLLEPVPGPQLLRHPRLIARRLQSAPRLLAGVNTVPPQALGKVEPRRATCPQLEEEREVRNRAHVWREEPDGLKSRTPEERGVQGEGLRLELPPENVRDAGLHRRPAEPLRAVVGLVLEDPSFGVDDVVIGRAKADLGVCEQRARGSLQEGALPFVVVERGDGLACCRSECLDPVCELPERTLVDDVLKREAVSRHAVYELGDRGIGSILADDELGREHRLCQDRIQARPEIRAPVSRDGDADRRSIIWSQQHKRRRARHRVQRGTNGSTGLEPVGLPCGARGELPRPRMIWMRARGSAVNGTRDRAWAEFGRRARLALALSGKKIYSRTVPRSLRKSSLGRRLSAFLLRFLPHDAVYDASYYADVVEPAAAASSDVIAASIVRDLCPGSVFDVGCGTGALLAALARRGCRVEGIDRSQAALDYCRSRGLLVHRFDLERDDFSILDGQQWDIVVSMEVAEHLPAAAADRFVDLLMRLGHTIVFSAAPKGQGGMDHVNEQPVAYWTAKFIDRSFVMDETLTNRWRRHWQASEVVQHYWANLMVLRRAGELGTAPPQTLPAVGSRGRQHPLHR